MIGIYWNSLVYQMAKQVDLPVGLILLTIGLSEMGCLDNCWEHLDTVASKKGLEVDLLAGVCEEQAIDSCWEESQETVRPLVLGTSQNASTGSSASPQDNGISNSNLSEDELANQRYGLLYQEIEAGKEEVHIPYVV